MRIIALFLALFSTMLAASPYQEGQHYQRLSTAITQKAAVQDLTKAHKNSVIVLEFFSYGCHWCYKLDPYVETLRKKLPHSVIFERVPVEFQPSWQTLTKAYYTQLNLKAEEKVHGPLFAAIHTDRFSDSSENALRAFFVARGVNGEDFTKTYRSADVKSKQQSALALSKALQIMSVPSIVVIGPKGAYMSTMSMAGNETMLINLIENLVRSEMAPQSGTKKKAQ